MNLNQFCAELNRTVPPMPESFDRAMRQTLDAIVAQEAEEIYPARKRAEHRPAHAQHRANRAARRWVVYLLAAILLLGAVAFAASRAAPQRFRGNAQRKPAKRGAADPVRPGEVKFQRMRH